MVIYAFKGYVRRGDFEPKQTYLAAHVHAHVFLEDKPGGAKKEDVYTDNPRFEAALLAAFDPFEEDKQPIIEVHYKDVTRDINRVTQVTLDRNFKPTPQTKA